MNEAKRARPVCVTSLALALVLGGCMNIRNGSTLSEVPDGMLAGLGNFTILMGLAAFVVAYGVWKLRQWAFYYPGNDGLKYAYWDAAGWQIEIVDNQG